jgi:diguanylate cyclase (GGDEF)-like protein
MMPGPLKLLLVEDSPRDTALLSLHLKRGGYEPLITRVETAAEMERELSSGSFDAIISDYCLPHFSAPAALEVLLRSGLDLPFIVVSGAVGEEIAVDMMRAGAHDYMGKDKLTRLVPAIEREIQEAQQRRAKRRAETLFQAILRSSPDPTVIVDRNTLEVVESSDSFRHLVSRLDPRGVHLFELISLSQSERIVQLIERGRGIAWYVVYENAGETRVANARVHTAVHEGTSYAYLVLQDVTEQHYLKAAFDAVTNAVMIISPQNTLLYANRAAEELFDDLVLGTDVVPLLNNPGLEAGWWLRPTARYEEYRLKIGGKPYEAASVTFRFAGHDGKSTILTVRSLEQEEELLQLATHDALTGLHNLRYFTETATRHIEEGDRTKSVALTIVDLDYFKPINDELGHAAGDAALITFANLVRNELKPGDVFARIGGDEFVILFPEATESDATATLDRVYDRMKRSPFVWEGSTRPFSASCGVTALRAGDTFERMKRRADEALYEAKRVGRGRYVVAGNVPSPRTNDRHDAMESRLR